MGCPCGKTQANSQAQSSTGGGPISTEQAENRFQTKKKFQKEWERVHRDSIHDLTSIFPLATILNTQDIHKVYTFDGNQKELGSGHFGIVRRARLKIEPNKVYAIKSIDKTKLKGNMSLLRNELDLLRFSDHPNIIQFYEIFQDNKTFHFVMECCEGGDVTSYIEKNGPLTEQPTKWIIFQTLLAINHLHSCGVIHRDIKPDNFLFKAKSLESPIKLIDFGLSKKWEPQSSKLKTILGTPYYVAPEVLEKKGYDYKCDVWSTGIMMFVILAADFPFKGANQMGTFEKIKKTQYSVEDYENVSKLSPEGKEFLSKLLEKNPEKRYTAREALRDPWFDSINMRLNEVGRSKLTPEVLRRFHDFRAESRFVKETIRLLVMIHDDTKEVSDLRDAFFFIDTLNNGVIIGPEIKNAFEELGRPISESEIDEIMQSLELRIKGVVTYTEFITACIDSSFYQNKAYLLEAFNRFDINHDRFIHFGDITDCFTRFGIDMPKEEVIKMISDADTNMDKKISFEEFVALMGGNMHAGSRNSNSIRNMSNPLHSKTEEVEEVNSRLQGD
jgi:calcium-dependent protein kinase